MKKLTFTIAMIAVCTSMSFADFDYIISNTFEFGVEIEGNETLLVTGGGADQIDAYDSSYIEIQNTPPYQFNVGGIHDLNLLDSSSLHFYDGEIVGLDIYSDATAVLEGGHISFIESLQDVWEWDYGVDPPEWVFNPHIEIKCNTYNFNSSTNLLTGTWLDNSAFSINLKDRSGYDPVIDNIFFTPEPASLALLGLGGFLLRRKRS